jgi:uncharacterized protein with HEPN domain
MDCIGIMNINVTIKNLLLRGETMDKLREELKDLIDKIPDENLEIAKDNLISAYNIGAYSRAFDEVLNSEYKFNDPKLKDMHDAAIEMMREHSPIKHLLKLYNNYGEEK